MVEGREEIMLNALEGVALGAGPVIGCLGLAFYGAATGQNAVENPHPNLISYGTLCLGLGVSAVAGAAISIRHRYRNLRGGGSE